MKMKETNNVLFCGVKQLVSYTITGLHHSVQRMDDEYNSLLYDNFLEAFSSFSEDITVSQVNTESSAVATSSD